jgi:antitoxin component YwqK of YwqJK toxin-antitoxin module
VSKFLVVCLFISCSAYNALSQGFTRHTYHDAGKKNLKEVYQVKDTIRNILHGRYISYYLNGNIESKGQFANNETTGVWEFFYETGNLKMRGILRQNSNYGLWEYFYESGQKSMDGTINGKNREGEWKSFYENGQLKEIGEYKENKRSGLWKMYFEDGALKGEIDYTDDFGMLTEYYHSGKTAGQGPLLGSKYFGHWRFFADDGALESEGDYSNGKKNGDWINYYSDGKILSKGSYENDESEGRWENYFENGKVSSTGEYTDGQKNGDWKVYTIDGGLKSEITFIKGSGEYREYYKSGKLKAKGRYENGKRNGVWEYYYEDGKREGQCEFNNGKGTYFGYYPNGNLQTKGTLEDDVKTGTWDLFETDGKLSGYYRPFYDDHKLSKEITALAGTTLSNGHKKSTRKHRFTYFDQRINEFKGVIVGGNPILTLAGRLPISMEFYQQERLGHEFEFVALRDPFFVKDNNIAYGKLFERGYSISIKQKFYNPLQIGMWYFGHEIRFTNLGHYTNREQPVPQNPDFFFTASAVEQRIEWGPLLGYRIMRNNSSKGFTIDAFVSMDFGYRGFNVEPIYDSYFSTLNHSKFSHSFHFGLNLGNVFSFR